MYGWPPDPDKLARLRAQADALQVGPRGATPTYTLADSWRMLGASANQPAGRDEMVGSIAMGMLPGLGEAQDLAALQDALDRGDVSDAMLAGGGLMLPVVGGQMLRAAGRVLRTPIEAALGIADEAAISLRELGRGTAHAGRRLWTRFADGYWLPRYTDVDDFNEVILDALLGEQTRFERALDAWMENPVGPQPRPPTRNDIIEALNQGEQAYADVLGPKLRNDSYMRDRLGGTTNTVAFTDAIRVPEDYLGSLEVRFEDLSEAIAYGGKTGEELELLIEARDAVEAQMATVARSGGRVPLPGEALDAVTPAYEVTYPTKGSFSDTRSRQIVGSVAEDVASRRGVDLAAAVEADELYAPYFMGLDLSPAVTSELAIMRREANFELRRASMAFQNAVPGSRAAEIAERRMLEAREVQQALTSAVHLPEPRVHDRIVSYLRSLRPPNK